MSFAVRVRLFWSVLVLLGALGGLVPAFGTPLLGSAARVLRGVEGCALVMDRDTGEILDGWHLAKATERTYGASSVLKPVVAYGALIAGVLRPDERLGGQNDVLRQTYGKGIASYLHGSGRSLDLFTAMAVSDNPFFYEAGARLGEERVRAFFRAFGYGRPTGIVPGKEASGTVPEKLVGLDALHFLGWGGPRMRVTAAQMLVATAAFGNGGVFLKPFRTPASADVQGVLGTPWAVEIVRQSLRQVVVEGRGKPAHVPGCTVFGKTGSVTDAVTGKRLGIFAGFTEGLSRDVAFVVVVEGATSVQAATLAGRLVTDLRKRLMVSGDRRG